MNALLATADIDTDLPWGKTHSSSSFFFLSSSLGKASFCIDCLEGGSMGGNDK